MRVNLDQDFICFADESGISEDRFTVVGGLLMRSNRAAEVYSSLEKYRFDHSMRSELKWSKISNQKLDNYISLIDLFFALNSSNLVQFHCLMFDNHQWNHKKFNNGDPDIGLSKLYYDLIVHKFVKRCGKGGKRLLACLDHRNSSTALEDLRLMINRTAARDFAMPHRPLAQLISKDSKSDDILQMNDVILGAVCAIKNGRHLLSGTREAKRVIAQYVLSKSGLECFDIDSPTTVHRFTVWNKKPRSR